MVLTDESNEVIWVKTFGGCVFAGTPAWGGEGMASQPMHNWPIDKIRIKRFKTGKFCISGYDANRNNIHKNEPGNLNNAFYPKRLNFKRVAPEVHLFDHSFSTSKTSFMNIQVYNLSRNTSDADLRKLFSAYGIVDSAEVVRDKLNGRSKGNGIVDMPVEKDARQAIAALDQTMMDGKKISVSELRLPPQW